MNTRDIYNQAIAEVLTRWVRDKSLQALIRCELADLLAERDPNYDANAFWHAPDKPTTTYATDGKCHNSNHGTFNHECGRPATWIGTSPTGFRSGFCDHCKEHGDERHGRTWQRLVEAK